MGEHHILQPLDCWRNLQRKMGIFGGVYGFAADITQVGHDHSSLLFPKRFWSVKNPVKSSHDAPDTGCAARARRTPSHECARIVASTRAPPSTVVADGVSRNIIQTQSGPSR